MVETHYLSPTELQTFISNTDLIPSRRFHLLMSINEVLMGDDIFAKCLPPLEFAVNNE